MATCAEAGLIKRDFVSVGDGLLITDTTTNLDWLSPVATRGEVYESATIQGIRTTYGFQYATYIQTADMLTSNFGSVTTTFPGDAAGFTAANNFFAVFGITLSNISCTDPNNQVVPCPRTQGRTSDTGAYANSHLAIGMITFGSNGWMITNNSTPDSTTELQVGNWLVRESTLQAQAPEPASVGLVLAGAVALFIRRRNRSA